MSTIQRITGSNSGLDVDALVKASMTTYQNKIDKETQNKKILEYQQEQYKKIISDASDFYDKYFDILKTGNLFSSSTYQSISFKSGDDTKVTAKGFAGADVSDYKVSVTKLASKASHTVTSTELDNVKTSGKGVIAVNMGTTNVYVDVVFNTDKTAIDMEKTTENLNTKLKAKGINVTAKYSEFAKGIVLQSGEMGEDVSFKTAIKEGFSEEGIEDKTDNVTALVYSSHTGTNAEGVITKGTQTYPIDDNSNIITVDDVQFTLKGITSNSSNITSSSITNLLEEHISNTEYTLSNGRKVTIGNDGTTTIDASFVSNGKTFNIDGSITSSSTITIGSTSTSITSIFGDSITKSLTDHDADNNTDTAEYTLNNGVKIKIYIDNNNSANSKVTIMDGENSLDSTDSIEFTNDDGTKMTIKGDGTVTSNAQITSSTINTLLTDNNISVSDTVYTLDNMDSNKIKIASDGTIKVMQSDGITEITDPIELTNDDGSKITINKDGTLTTSSDNSVTLTGSTDVTELKDKVVKFINDYNTLLSSINTKIYEERDKDYLPLTDAQKEAMTDDQVEKWEKKVQTGLLRKDSNLERITSAMKSAMSSVISGSGLYLEKIGITPVDNYQEKNGMYTIDEAKLTTALEENAGNIKDLFTRDASTGDKGGIITQLKSTLYDEFKTSTSVLSQKVGLDGTSTQYSNTLSDAIYKKKTLISELNNKYSDKETALYNKYSALETALQNLTAQQSSLASMLGTS
ncbi:flagellar filament capping protein FliD [Clostridium chromiireducens]|uniref:Flagellar hook-associated protein 2 n=1 Tax=Clostridium chromiireducens TaxID=225345 RepID=A0A964RIQ4_9CLOT|nr:flagellar filament capping protein FliD [Clostridium chromiireducens]MVX62356.1 flagellar filament capping protein FliD [Clostridium chromiireducens]